MSPARWQQLKQLYAELDELPPEQRCAYLDQACAEDAELRAQVEALLAHQEQGRAEDFLEQPLARLPEPAPLSGEAAVVFHAGQLIGERFQIEALLGAGGMGEVYRAWDRKLHRRVALKVLPAHLTQQPALQQRFQREARAVSALSHPQICPLYDMGREGERDYLVLEYLEGETLATRLQRGPLSPAEWRLTAEEICRALAYAHQHGVIHRDLKPGNIMLTASGAKLLDFGLAKHLSPLRPSTTSVAAEASSLASLHTDEGTILGTVAYMSPEQAEGKAVDGRSDIFSFGCVLYEMVTGARAFQGDSRISTLAAILRGEPRPMRELVPLTPPALEQIVKRCLEKEPSARAQTIDEVRTTLANLILPTYLPAHVPLRIPILRWALLAAPLLVVVLGVVLGQRWWVNRLDRNRPPQLVQLTRDSGLTNGGTLSPDGKLAVYISDRSSLATPQLWLQQVDGRGVVQLTKDCQNVRNPAFAADGSRVFFSCDQGGLPSLYEIPVIGGEPRILVKVGSIPRPSPDGKWLHYMGGPATATPFLLALKDNQSHRWRNDFELLFPGVAWSPDSRNIAFVGAQKASDHLSGDLVDIWVAPLAGGPAVNTHLLAKLKPRFGPYDSPEISAWLPGNRIVFSCRIAEHRNLWLVHLSARTWQPTTEPEQLTSDISEASGGSFAAGRLVFDSSLRHFTIAEVSLNGPTLATYDDSRTLTRDDCEGTLVGVTPTGGSAVFVSERLGTGDLYRLDRRTKQVTRLTVGANLKARTGTARMSPDGTLVAYEGHPTVPNGSHVQSSVWMVPVQGGVAQHVCDQCGRVGDWLPDNRGLVLWTIEPDPQVSLLELNSGRRSVLLRQPGHVFVAPRLSPDGQWLAFDALTQNRTVSHLFIAPLRSGSPIPESAWSPFGPKQEGERWTVCAWSPGGRNIYFINFGSPTIWLQQLDAATKDPIGSAKAVIHLDGGVRLPGFGLAVTNDHLFFDFSHWTGNVWMMDRTNWQ